MGFFSKLFGARKEEDEGTDTPMTEGGEEIVEGGGTEEETPEGENSSEEPII